MPVVFAIKPNHKWLRIEKLANLENGNAIVFGRRGDRPDILWLDDMDGSDGFRYSDDERTGLFDVNGDGYDDLVFEDGSAFAGRQRSLDANGPRFVTVERGPAILAASWNRSNLTDAAGYRLEFGGRLVAELDIDVLDHTFRSLTAAAPFWRRAFARYPRSSHWKRCRPSSTERASSRYHFPEIPIYNATDAT